jgi:hypothetical protein
MMTSSFEAMPVRLRGEVQITEPLLGIHYQRRVTAGHDFAEQ